jgi:hypothetical protein
LAVAGGAELHLGLEIVARVRWHDDDVETNPSADNQQKQTCEHGFLPQYLRAVPG